MRTSSGGSADGDAVGVGAVGELAVGADDPGTAGGYTSAAATTELREVGDRSQQLRSDIGTTHGDPDPGVVESGERVAAAHGVAGISELGVGSGSNACE